MPLQILTLKLDGITAGDYLTWCRDADPPALDFALRSISIDADPLGDTITAILDWNHPAPSPRAAAPMAGLPLAPGAQIHASPTDVPRTHELALAFADLGGATFALAQQGALNDQRLVPRVQHIHDLFAQLTLLDRPTRTREPNDKPVTTMAA
jgi:hypothetical protein